MAHSDVWPIESDGVNE